ncbi:MAG: SIR2 family protein [Candidatus Didemnitutus sp.]|nr:SIR2 family protein [Candidatus Didemnitutus sp.]
MNAPANPEAELRQRILDRKAVLVAGTGVSIAASIDPATGKPNPQASWVGLLEHGLQHGLKMTRLTQQEVDAYRNLLQVAPTTQNFISVAAAVTSALGGSRSTIFRDWLAGTVGKITAHDRSALDALDALRQHGNLLATTNYDSLLLGARADLVPINWTDRDAFLCAARGERPNSVIFLHGHWESPASVVLDWKSYEEISRDENYRTDLVAFWKMTTWVYIGCGVNGLSDPDFGLLLERHGERARNAGHWDFCLVRKKDQKLFQKQFDDNKLNICAVPIGAEHTDLPKFLRSLLPAPVAPVNTATPLASVAAAGAKLLPQPPAFYAEPDYIGSHKFVGRAAELQVLSDWAKPADPTNLLLFEAIGGNGKSMLTWEWTKNHALAARPADRPWAGRFWYSFYERGAIMADFCQRALAYMTGRPLEDFAKKKTADLKDDLLAQLHARPWLLILDGLERILVAYHRIDAAEVPDEEANSPTDKIVNRNPCDAIRDEDNDLLRALAAAAPSKLLVSSRLTPRVLLNPSGQPIPGAKRITLPGLRPPDAEALLRSCGIEGRSAAIQGYLTANCDNHPLVIGILGGLIANYLPARGNFDAWSAALDGGAALDLARLDLIQRRNHILEAAIKTLPDASRQLLSTLALLTDSVDYETLKAFNPHLPPEPEEVEKPTPPEEHWRWERRSEEERRRMQTHYKSVSAQWEEYQKAVKAWGGSAEFRAAPKKLEATVNDLEQRSLLQWDRRTRRYDLHPVVRGVASSAMAAADRERHGQRVVDHFTAQPHRPYDEAETLEDVGSGLHVVRTLLKLGHYQQAADAYTGDLAQALRINLEAYVETLSLLRPFFPAGWDQLPQEVDDVTASRLANEAASALHHCGEDEQAILAYGAKIRGDLRIENLRLVRVRTGLCNMSVHLWAQNRLAASVRVHALILDLPSVNDNAQDIFWNRLVLFVHQSRLGQWPEAMATWHLLDPMGRQWSRATYREGRAEFRFAEFQFWQGCLREEFLAAAEILANKDQERITLRDIHRLRGTWRLEQSEWALAAASFTQAVTMSREVSLVDEESETGLALAKVHLGQLTPEEVRSEVQRLAQLRRPAHRTLALLWTALGDHDQAKHHALKAYTWAWADGEPFVNRYELTKTTELLHELGVPIPNLPPYDSTKDEPFPWEADVRTAIEKLRAEKKVKQEKSKNRRKSPPDKPASP